MVRQVFMSSLIISVGLCGFIHRPLTNTARPDNSPLRQQGLRDLTEGFTQVFRKSYKGFIHIIHHLFPQVFHRHKDIRSMFLDYLINEQNTLHSCTRHSEYIHEQKYTKNWCCTCGKNTNDWRIDESFTSPVRIIHEQVFIHECKSLFQEIIRVTKSSCVNIL